jgi:spermidine synthase
LAEILRDYGFVESFPQIWHYQAGNMQFELDVTEEGKFNLTWMYDMYPKNDFKPDDRLRAVVWLKRQIRHLYRIRNVDYKDGNPGIPEHEWNTAWEFQKANIRAMTAAIASLEAIESGITDEKELMQRLSHITMEQFEANYSHYDALDWELDDVDYLTQTCDNAEILKFHDHAVVEAINTHYQNLNFAIHPTTLDVMMDLDDIVQIASVYRPQYHEYVTHAAARFIPKVERVIFIGGGDSMLLHETLKYPDLKLVVGLELDQTVTRKSFQYFRSSPHFDDPRVEWWFGDATKSLLLLSQEYWQSFDLVLVDLSETVMSLTVTQELDVFDALALLLKHEGVMVKNELYMEPFSKVFDYSMDLLYECPLICNQVLAFGSNKVDFMHDPVYDHGIDTFLYKNMHDPYTRHNFAHDFRMNNATKQGKCGRLPEVEKLDEQARSAGIVEIVDAEKVAVPLDESLVALFLKVIQDQGFRPLADPIYNGGMLMIAMKEGYVLARLFPNEKYCNLDIHVWGKFHKLKALSEGLTKALGSGLVSKFRIVVGGMYGSDTWPEDREMIGPQIVQTRNCEIPVPGEAPDLSEELIIAAFEESVNLVQIDEIVAVVVCQDAEDCLATKLLEKNSRIDKLVKISTCPYLVPGDLDKQYSCEISTTLDLKAKLGEDLADLVVVDSSTPYEMFQILNSILSREDFRKSIIDETNVFIVWSMDAEKEEYQRNFLDRYRKQHEWDPIARAEIWIQDGTRALEFGVLATEDKQIIFSLADVEANINERFKDVENVSIKLRGIYGGLYEYQHDFNPTEFLQSDYDTEEGFKHYYDQKPLARHVVVQLEEAQNQSFDLTIESLSSALAKALEAVPLDCATQQSFTEMGEGGIILCLNPAKGSALLVWDGRKHVDISFYVMDNDQEAGPFIEEFLEHVENKLTVTLRDDMPRGTGRVINFASDIRTPAELKEFYDTLEDLVKKEDDDDEEEDDDDDNDIDGSLSEL